jgi:CelD/BcsL family acetyltransferase involved in cellulose biosynthesis
MSEAAGYTLEVLRDRAALEHCAEEWRALPQARSSPLLCPEWGLAALPALHARSHVLALRVQGALAALAPLARQPRAGIDRIEFLGAARLHEPAGFLYADTSALTVLCAGVVTQRRPVVLQRVPATGPLIEAFEAAARGRGTLLVRPASAAPHVEFARDFAAWESGLSSRRRQDYRRARRRLEQGGPVTFDLRIPTPASVSVELDEAMRVEASGWKERRGSALASNAELGSYFRDLAARLAARGSLRICFLRAGGQAIATQISIEHARRWWILKIGYDESWAEYSPGIQLMWDVVRHAGETGLEGIEMLGSAESWLSIWARESREYRTLVFYPHNLRGLAALAADGVDAALRRLRRKK